MKYKVGDKVRINSLDWYNKHKNNYGHVVCGNYCLNSYNKHWCGKIVTIEAVYSDCYIVKENGAYWNDKMIEGLVEDETKPKFKVGDKVILDPYPCVVTDVNWRDSLHGFVYTVIGLDFGKMVGEADLIFDTSEEEVDLIPKFGEYGDNESLDIPTMTTEFVKEHGFPCPEGYQFVDEGGNVINATKIVLEKKKKEYPKTFLGCCDVLGIEDTISRGVKGYKSNLLDTFQKLLICRDAYWKIAGEEMGLDGPWEPDWNNISDKYCIYFVSGYVWSKECQTRQCPFAFPTAEMRDAFYDNFKKDIEECKELL